MVTSSGGMGTRRVSVTGRCLSPRSPCAETVSVHRRLTSGRDFSRVKRWPRRQERPHLLRQGGVGQVEMGFGRVGHVDADQLGGIFQGEPVGDVAADVAAVSSETLIAEDGHELDPQARDAPDCPAVSG